MKTFPNGYIVSTSECGASYARRHNMEVMAIYDKNKNEINSEILDWYSEELGYGYVHSNNIMNVLAEVKKLPAIVWNLWRKE